MLPYSIIPIILWRFWIKIMALSRESFPKQYLEINSQNKQSLLQNTQNRIKDTKNITSPILVCNEEHRFIVAEQMREINMIPISILLELLGGILLLLHFQQ